MKISRKIRNKKVWWRLEKDGVYFAIKSLEELYELENLIRRALFEEVMRGKTSVEVDSGRR